MSYEIKDETKIYLTRGDTMRVKVDIQKDGESYTPVDGDVVRFALKHATLKQDKSDFTDQDPLILKTIPNGTMILELEPSDTKNLGFGLYKYDIQITFADGTVDTFITDSPLKLTKEVE